MNDSLKKIRVIVSDVDGVLTDGVIRLVGDDELKAFCGKDAPRIASWLRAGGKMTLFTARKCTAVERRAQELKIDLLYKPDLKESKRDLFDVVREKYDASPEEILYMGDDWSDLHYQKRCGVAVVPADGSDENKKLAHIVTKALGGQGVAAEAIELVMRAQGTWDTHVEKYLAELTY